MNIHFNDRDLFEKLKSATLAKVKVGSHMYGTNNENSDTDYLYIYATSENELFSAMQTHHQLQFKEDNIDYNFVSLHNFLKNCISGDSTINFEVIHSGELNGTDLDWLSKYKDSFITYSIIRSYLGLARRDIKHYFKYTDDYNKRKRLGHIVRGHIYAKEMLNESFDFAKANAEFKSIKLDVSDNKMLRKYEAIISVNRDWTTKHFNDKTLKYAQNFEVKAGIELTKELCDFCKSDVFKAKQKILSDFNTDAFIESFENWVNY
ncbi:MAG: nucleotidyltransferase domain-containing protein [Candidatus Pacearchaeota archaeon]|jgi:predicted nucleotidyltransferase|nr:nucleotidyltransferase domain-containing protein [Clostridia bacterium]